MKLLIVESPNKCKTLKHILGDGWQVEATVGHITELAKDGEYGFGFDITPTGVNCRYVATERGAKVIAKLKAAAAKSECVYIATDPDREGEAIGWHVLQQVVGNKAYHRVTYTQITDVAVKAAIASPRKLDMGLVNAQMTRQVIDRLVGFTLSKKVQTAGVGASAGRVQSAALHIIAKREREIKNFKPVAYWSITSQYGEGFQASYIGEELIAEVEEVDTPVDEAADGEEAKESSSRVLSELEANRIVAIAQKHPHKVIEFTGKKGSKNAPPPLTTSGLQQAAGVKYGYSPDQVMKLAQELFEGMKLPDGTHHGAITYHRTDSVSLAPEFCEEVTAWLRQKHPELVPSKSTSRKDKAGSQGAHEAIRPVNVANTPDAMKAFLSADQHKVYSLIWQRAVASLCAPAQFDRTRAVIQAGSTFWVTNGSIVTSPGYSTILGSLGDDAELPKLTQGQTLKLTKCSNTAKKTSPPGRFSEPRLVQTLERSGIGRPSTYASIMTILKSREYVKLEKKSLVPTEMGMNIDAFLMLLFPMVCDAKFTATMEGTLDLIAEAKKAWEAYVYDFNSNLFEPTLRKNSDNAIAKFVRLSDKPCPQCKQMLRMVKSKNPPKFPGDKDHYLRCGGSCEGEVYFWNTKLSDWIHKGTVLEKTVSPPGRLTEFICQGCGKPIEEFAYSKEGVAKIMLRCSDPAARAKKDHEPLVYFQGKEGKFWSFGLNSEPLTQKVEGGAKPVAKSAKPGGAAKSTKAGTKGKSGKAKKTVV